MVVGTLYQTDVSPPVRAVLLAEKALGIELEHIEVSLHHQDHLKPEYVKKNPQHSVPMYQDQDGTLIWDSHAIMAFLVGKYGKDDSLYPKDLAMRALVDQRLHFDSGHVFCFIRAIILPILKHNAKDLPNTYQLAAIEESYEILNAFLQGNRWMTGEHLTIADLSLIASISSICHILPISQQHTNLLQWIRQCEQLPYYQEANGVGVDKFQQFYASIKVK